MIRGNLDPEIRVPSWVREELVRNAGMAEQQARSEQDLRGDLNRRAWAETKGSLVNPVIQRVFAGLSTLGLRFGVEMRAPLLDRRVVEFALARPRNERASQGAVKHLLRAAAEGLLPASVLLPRPRKTGVLTDYFSQSFRADRDGVVSAAFAQPILAELGIVDARQVRRAWEDYRSGRDADGGRLYVAFQTELWLRARAGKGSPICVRNGRQG